MDTGGTDRNKMTIRAEIKRKRYSYKGIVQGVGFRPTVYRCAISAGVTGFVQNRRSVVVAEVEGPATLISDFENNLQNHLPSAARLDSIGSEDIAPMGDESFLIIESEDSDYIFPPIPPDLALCADCRRELLDPENRRYLYPFITCTVCGPRYSIVCDTPFDRENTSMAEFNQCPECLKEYRDPDDRRFHSQTNSCSICGPAYFIHQPEGHSLRGIPAGDKPANHDPVKAAIEELKEGKIVAVQGIGGFHLAADPLFPDTVEKLRGSKGRETKPFALMARDIPAIEKLCSISGREKELLLSAESPIVILELRDHLREELRTVSDTGTLGVMLPYTPIHQLLFSHPEIDIPYRYLIMTSGNFKSEPIITDPEYAFKSLSDVADLFLYHNRRIIHHCDDSLIRVQLKTSGDYQNRRNDTQAPPCILRRSRGYVPRVLAIRESVNAKTLAVGGDLKNSPAFVADDTIYLAPYIGDLEAPLTLEKFDETINRIIELYKVRPERLVYDLHPGYHSTAWAEANTTIDEKIQIQHHHAHILSVMAEHGLEEAIGLGCDGTGYGTDGTIWGCEFLYVTRSEFTRIGCLKPFRLPGGDESAYNPRRIAYSILRDIVGQTKAAELSRMSAPDQSAEGSLVHEMLEKNINSPLSSSAGRLFDAVSAVLGLIGKGTYEGEGPIKLEQAAIRHIRNAGGEKLFQPSYAREFPGIEILSFSDRPAQQVLEIHKDTVTQKGTAPDNRTVLPPDFVNPRGNGSLRFILDPGPLLVDLAKAGRGENLGMLAFRFHKSFAEAVIQGIQTTADETGITTVCLSGGVFQNMLLLELVALPLHRRGFEVFLNNNFPPGDGGLAIGQAYFK